MTGRTVIATLLVIIALLAIAVGVIYLIEPIHSLPSFFPGHGKPGGHSNAKHSKRGLIAVVVGVVILVVGFVVAAVGRRERASSYRY